MVRFWWQLRHMNVSYWLESCHLAQWVILEWVQYISQNLVSQILCTCYWFKGAYSSCTDGRPIWIYEGVHSPNSYSFSGLTLVQKDFSHWFLTSVLMFHDLRYRWVTFACYFKVLYWLLMSYCVRFWAIFLSLSHFFFFLKEMSSLCWVCGHWLLFWVIIT